MNRNQLKALAEMEDGDYRPGVDSISEYDIREWGEDPAGGGLPAPSADAFAKWLNKSFYDWNEDGELTNEQVLKSARAYWVGKA